MMLVSLLLSSAAAHAAPADLDRAAIKAQAGCYEVTYEYAETFAHKEGYQLAKPYKTGGSEWIVVTEDTPDRISLQHLLLTGAGAMKHWRQEWEHAPQSVLAYKGRQTWERQPVSEAADWWAQHVYSVDDSPRYDCAAPWIHWRGHDYWECEAWSPLPRREYTQRHDYDVMARGNRQELTPTGWRHEQNNTKLILAADGSATPLVEERGRNTYRRLPDGECADAAAWWSGYAQVWRDIQAAWRGIYAERAVVKLATQRDGTALYEALDRLAEDGRQATPYDAAAVQAKARDLITRYLD